MTAPLLQIVLNLALAWAAGALIGFERSFNGRAAGLRTHALVSLSSATVMTIACAPMVTTAFGGVLRLDPTRLAQGVMTGIGFLGAGVIFKEGVNVQGLTTAAAIWSSAAIGLLFGLGLPTPAAAALAGVLFTLTAMRWVEGLIPWRVYAETALRFQTGLAPSEEDLERMMSAHKISLGDVSYRLMQGGELFEVRAAVLTRRDAAFRDLAERLKTLPGLVEYDLDRISK